MANIESFRDASFALIDNEVVEILRLVPGPNEISSSDVALVEYVTWSREPSFWVFVADLEIQK